jgi:hypothetical protein
MNFKTHNRLRNESPKDSHEYKHKAGQKKTVCMNNYITSSLTLHDSELMSWYSRISASIYAVVF